MKKVMTVMVGVALFVLALGTTEVRAASDNAAIVIHRNNGTVFCGLNLGGIPLFTDEEVVAISTKGGNVQLTCHFDIQEELRPENVIQSIGFTCSISVLLLTTYRETEHLRA